MAGRSSIERADREAAARAAPAGEHRVMRLLGRASEIADQPPMIALSAAVLAAGLLWRNRRLADTGGRMLAAELAATAMKSAIKANIDRTRPHVEANGGRYRAEPGDSDDSALNSFPSGHTAGAVAVARTVARAWPAARWPALVGAGAIAAIQVPRLKHYPSDLLAGAAIGLLADALVLGATTALARALPRPDRTAASRA